MITMITIKNIFETNGFIASCDDIQHQIRRCQKWKSAHLLCSPSFSQYSEWCVNSLRPLQHRKIHLIQSLKMGSFQCFQWMLFCDLLLRWWKPVTQIIISLQSHNKWFDEYLFLPIEHQWIFRIEFIWFHTIIGLDSICF